MSFSPRFCALAALFVLASLLFAQIATAVHFCAVQDGTARSTHAADASDAAPDCMEHAGNPSALCHAHCQDGKQNLVKADALSIAPLLALGFLVVLLSVPAARRAPIAFPFPHLARAIAPPLSIRNCCLRN